MHPYLISTDSWSLVAYPVLYGLGIAVGGIVVLVLGLREGLDTRRLAHLFLMVCVSVVVGGRLFCVLQHHDEFRHAPTRALDLTTGGQVLYGGLILAVPVLLVGARLLRLPLAQTTDLFAVGAPLGVAIGRWGCLCSGCCYGRPTDLPWSISYPRHVDLAGEVIGAPAFTSQLKQGLLGPSADFSLPVHPTPIYESIVSLAVFALLLWLWRRRQLSGRLSALYLVLYAFGRFWLEFARENELAVWGLTIPQVMSIAVVIAGGAALILLGRRRESSGKAVPQRRRARRRGYA